jgi:Sec-independent protein secretion pathway component TatC
MEELLNDVLAILRPDTLADYFIYFIFLLAFVQLLVTPERNDQVVYLVFFIIICCVLDLLRQADGSGIPITAEVAGIRPFADEGFATFLMHLAMAVLPFINAGLIRRKDRTGKLAVPIALLSGMVGTVYVFAAFFAPQIVYVSV